MAAACEGPPMTADAICPGPPGIFFGSASIMLALGNLKGMSIWDPHRVGKHD